MKIIPNWRPLGQDLKMSDNTNTQKLPPNSFSDVMYQRDQRMTEDQLNEQMKQIQLQGERLAKSMTVRELRLYKTLVKKFLEETVRRGVGLKDTRGWDRRGRSKRYKLIDEIDEALLVMADDLLSTEQGRIQLLYQVGEIRGMLLNLFF